MVVVVDRNRGGLRQCLETAGSRRPRHTGVSRLQSAEKSTGRKETSLPGSSANRLCLMRAKEGHDCLQALHFGVPGWKWLPGDHRYSATQRNDCWQPRALPNDSDHTLAAATRANKGGLDWLPGNCHSLPQSLSSVLPFCDGVSWRCSGHFVSCP